MVIIIWVGSAITTQIIFNSDDTEFPKPLFVTFYSTSFFILYLIPVVIRKAKHKIFPPQEDKGEIRNSPENESLAQSNQKLSFPF